MKCTWDRLTSGVTGGMHVDRKGYNCKCTADAMLLQIALWLVVTRMRLHDIRVVVIANPSVACNVCAPYSEVEVFGNISSPLCTLHIL